MPFLKLGCTTCGRWSTGIRSCRTRRARRSPGRWPDSFASTNKREGSEIARQVIRALTEAGIRIVFVTHLYDLAEGLYAQHDPAMLFLRAERRPDGRRTFRLPPGEPLPTSYGQDLYQSVFGTADHAARV